MSLTKGKTKDKLENQSEDNMQAKLTDYKPKEVSTINVQADIDEKLHAAVKKKIREEKWSVKGLIESSFKMYLGIKPEKKND